MNSDPSCDFDRMVAIQGQVGPVNVYFHDWVNYWIGTQSPEKWDNVGVSLPQP